MTDPDALGRLARTVAGNLRARALFLGPRPARPAPAAPPTTPVPVPEQAPAREQEPAGHPADGCATLEELAGLARECTACRLCRGRTTVVVGEGAPDARLLFLGEAPGFEEDRQGRPFVGPSGQLLTRMIAAMGLSREEVYIANVLKCRPPENRDPAPDEAAACRPWLERQIALLDPEVICTLGRHALSALAGEPLAMGRSRGRTLRLLGRTVVPTYHPAYLLRNPAAKREAWADLRRILGLLGIDPPTPRASGR